MFASSYESPWKRFRRAVVAAVCGAAALVAAALPAAAPAAAQQADPAKLLVELPADVTSLNCGETVDLQIVGETAAKQRVGFSGKTVEVSATFGAVEVIQQPYKFRYRTPATLPDITNVRIRAWLKEAPEIVGETIIQVIPPSPFKRLILQGAGSTPAGASLDVWLKGETPAGQITEVPENTVNVRVEGAGSITFVKAGRYRLDTPANANGNVRIVAALQRYPNIATTMDVLVTGGSGSAAPPPVSSGSNPPSSSGSGSGASSGGSSGGNAASGGSSSGGSSSGGASSGGSSSGGSNPPAPPSAGGSSGGTSSGSSGSSSGGTTEKPKPATDEDGDIVWTSGAVVLRSWQTRPNESSEWGPKGRDLPAAGKEFEAANPSHWVRWSTNRTDITKVELEEWPGDKKDKVNRIQAGKDASKDDRFRLVQDAKIKGWRMAYQFTIPENVRRWTVAVIQTTADGKTIRDEFVFVRKK